MEMTRGLGGTNQMPTASRQGDRHKTDYSHSQGSLTYHAGFASSRDKPDRRLPPAGSNMAAGQARRNPTSVPQRPQTARPTNMRKTPVPPPVVRQATDADAKRHKIPAGYSLKDWNPTEEPFMLLGGVFDANSLGKRIYDWTVYHYGTGSPIADIARDLWFLLFQLSGKIKRAEKFVHKIPTKDNREMVKEFIEAGSRLTDKFRKLLEACEAPMLRAKDNPNKEDQLGKSAGVELVKTLFDADREADKTDRFMASVRLWNLRFDTKCEELLKKPGGDIVMLEKENGQGLAPSSLKCSNSAPTDSGYSGSGLCDPENDEAARTGVVPRGTSPPSTCGDPMGLAPASPAPTATDTSYDTSYESDLLSISDSDPLDSLSPLDQRQPWMPSLQDAIVRRLVSSYQSHGHANTTTSLSPGGPRTAAASTSSNTAPGTATDNPSGPSRPNNNNSNNNKRKYDDDNDNDGDDDDDGTSNRTNPKPHPKRPKPSRLLACPFWKASPQHHRPCFPKILKRIRDVKQHLRRHHFAAFACSRCAAPFDSQAALHRHVSNPAGLFCTPSGGVADSVSMQQMLLLSRRSDAKLSEEEQWFVLWEVVFPGRARPGSAYREVGVSEELYSFREFCAVNAEDVLEGALKEAMVGFAFEDEEGRKRVLRWMGREGLEIAFGLWRDAAAAMGMEAGGGSGSNKARPVQGYATPARSASLPGSGAGAAGETRPPSGRESVLGAEGGLEGGWHGAADEDGTELDEVHEAVDDEEGEGDREDDGEEKDEGVEYGGAGALYSLQSVMVMDDSPNTMLGSGEWCSDAVGIDLIAPLWNPGAGRALVTNNSVLEAGI